MNESLEILALRKQVLVARSTFYRLRILHELNAVHQSRVARVFAFGSQALPYARIVSIALWVFRRIRGRKA
jgi:predicted metallopeptidase